MLYDTKISNNEFNGLYISSIVNKFISYALIYFYVIPNILNGLGTRTGTGLLFALGSIIAMYIIYIQTFKNLCQKYNSRLKTPETFRSSFMLMLKIVLLIHFIFSIGFNFIVALIDLSIIENIIFSDYLPTFYENNLIIAVFDIIAGFIYIKIVLHIFNNNFEKLKSSEPISRTPILIILLIVFTFVTVGYHHLVSIRQDIYHAKKTEQETTNNQTYDNDNNILNVFPSNTPEKTSKNLSNYSTYIFSENEIYVGNKRTQQLNKYSDITLTGNAESIMGSAYLPDGSDLDESRIEITYKNDDTIYFVYPSLNLDYSEARENCKFYMYDIETKLVTLLIDQTLYSYNFSEKKQSPTFDYVINENGKLYLSSFNYVTKEFRHVLKVEHPNLTDIPFSETKKIKDNFITLNYHKSVDSSIDNSLYHFYYNDTLIYVSDFDIDNWIPTEDFLIVFSDDYMYQIPYQPHFLNTRPVLVETQFKTSKLQEDLFYDPDLLLKQIPIYVEDDGFYLINVESFEINKMNNIPEILSDITYVDGTQFYNYNDIIMIIITPKNNVSFVTKETFETALIYKNLVSNPIYFMKFDIEGNLMLVKSPDTIEPLYFSSQY